MLIINTNIPVLLLLLLYVGSDEFEFLNFVSCVLMVLKGATSNGYDCSIITSRTREETICNFQASITEGLTLHVTDS